MPIDMIGKEKIYAIPTNVCVGGGGSFRKFMLAEEFIIAFESYF